MTPTDCDILDHDEQCDEEIEEFQDTDSPSAEAGSPGENTCYIDGVEQPNCDQFAHETGIHDDIPVTKDNEFPDKAGSDSGPKSMNQNDDPTDDRDPDNFGERIFEQDNNGSFGFEADAVTSTMLYNITGAVVAKTDPLSRTVKIAYADNFNSAPGVTTYAYPTTITDQNSQPSTVKYRYDIGANIEATSPAPAGQTYGKTSKRLFDSIGRLDRQSIYVNTTEKAYTRYEYPTNGIQSKSYTPVIDADGDNNIAEDEVYTESWFDGAGRVRGSRTEHPGSTGGWTATQTEYNVLGQVYRTSVPTEVSVSSPYDPSTWTAAGDDSTRGWIWNKTYYDWKGRTIRTVPSDSTGSDGKDTLIDYAGCGCAGGQVTTVSGPVTTAIDVSGTTQTTKRRTQKAYGDILGRTYKTEVWDLDGAGMPGVGGAYSTVKTTFNGRDQATLIRQYEGSDSSTTYQDTTMSYDGHGRLYQSHKPEQRDGSNNLKYTTYTYNPDDTVATQTDGRGVVTSDTYNSRALVTNIAWNVGGTGVTDPTDVTFTYDNLGNRTQMTDGLGQVDYSYSEMSQMLDETRDFTDTLADAPISGGKFKLEYTYTLSGSLKSYKDPYGEEIDYTHDKTGRLSTVTGSTFASVTSYSSSPEYRAWGALKHLDYANGNDVDISYDDQLKPLTYELKRSSTVLMEKEYEYYPSGEVKHVEGGVNNLVTFDFAGRPNKSKSGIEADGTSTATNLSTLPFRHAFTYNAFNNLVDFDWTRWTDTGTETHTITNNRRGYGQEDDDGRDLTKGHYDAAGNNYLQEPENLQYYRYFDGDRAESKRGVIIYNTTTELWEPVIYGYFIRSSVLGGQIVSEADATGKKTHTYVYADGIVLAHQVIKIVSGSPQESVAWEHRDPHNKRVQYASTAGGQPYGIGLESGDVDSLGRMVGTLTYTPPSHDAENTISPFYQAPEPVGTGQCRSVEDAIRNNCSPQSVAQQITKALGRWESVKYRDEDGNEDITWTWVDPSRDEMNMSQPFSKKEVNVLRDRISNLSQDCKDFIAGLINNVQKITGGNIVSTDVGKIFDQLNGVQGYLLKTPMPYAHMVRNTLYLPVANYLPSGYRPKGPLNDIWAQSLQAYMRDENSISTTVHELIHAAVTGPRYDERTEARAALTLEGKKFVPKTGPDTQDGNLKAASAIFQDRLATACGWQPRNLKGLEDYIQ